MHNNHNFAARIAAPIALAGALILSGCSAAVSAGEPAAETAHAGTGITAVSQLDRTNIDTWEDEHDADFEQLILDLNAKAATGLSEIKIQAWATDDVTIDILTDDDDGTITGDQLKSVLEVLQGFTTSKTVGTWTIQAWDQNFYQGDAVQAATEIGLKEVFIDRGWREVIVPNDRLQNLYN